MTKKSVKSVGDEPLSIGDQELSELNMCLPDGEVRFSGTYFHGQVGSDMYLHPPSVYMDDYQYEGRIESDTPAQHLGKN